MVSLLMFVDEGPDDDDDDDGTVLSHFGSTNSFGLMTILDTSPSPDLSMMDFNSSCVILPNPRGIHNAG
jgi:hypothetical protein